MTAIENVFCRHMCAWLARAPLAMETLSRCRTALYLAGEPGPLRTRDHRRLCREVSSGTASVIRPWQAALDVAAVHGHHFWPSDCRSWSSEPRRPCHRHRRKSRPLRHVYRARPRLFRIYLVADGGRSDGTVSYRLYRRKNAGDG